ncbi:cellulase family glycosylhydrolase [Alienimonas sp. DA493]|uniref:cellulase family glycosylhydrolase n=1 Tax=Alienimonas sp. DA493 TaxID=3373605 RepID=UPI003754F528
MPWGFNYDHDRDGRLIEDYWHEEWETVREDFAEMQALGANVVRVHLQLGRFMETPERPNARNLARLADLLALAEETGLRLDLTGLGCYHKADVPAWYDPLPEADRWAVQGRFWSAVAETCAQSPAVFCYDLMNEPLVAGAPREDWLGGGFAGKHFVQFLTLDPNGRSRGEIAREWIRAMTAAIREHDADTPITVGLIAHPPQNPGAFSGITPEIAVAELDYVCVHLYPETGKPDEALAMLAGFDRGKPVVIEETFPLKCSPEELETFLDRSAERADGWIGFYWGATPEELAERDDLGAALTAAWLDLFRQGPPPRPE